MFLIKFEVYAADEYIYYCWVMFKLIGRKPKVINVGF